ILVEVHRARRRQLDAHWERAGWLVYRGSHDRLPIARVVLDANETRVVVGLEPGGAVLEEIKISARRELHLDRSAEIRARHEALYGHKVTICAHGDCHDPMPHEFVNEKLAVVVLREWSGSAAEVLAVENRTRRRCSPSVADDREIGRCGVRIPDVRAACGRQFAEASVVGRAVDWMRRIELRSC